jgi:hypothetical protein
MMWISILMRRLKEGKTYEDFRKAWYHTVGFGTPCKLYSARLISWRSYNAHYSLLP